MLEDFVPPCVHILSFIAIGIPARRPNFSHLATFSSISFAFCSASSVLSNKKASILSSFLFYLHMI